MMKTKITKTNAARLLEREHAVYELIAYPVDENDLSAVHVATVLKEDIRSIFKTLVLKGDRSGLFVCIIPGNEEVDLKTAARISGNKKADMIPMKELLPATGYIRGGCSPIGMKKKLPTWIHRSCLDFDSILISAGIRGLQIRIAPAELIRVSDAFVEDLTGE